MKKREANEKETRRGLDDAEALFRSDRLGAAAGAAGVSVDAPGEFGKCPRALSGIVDDKTLKAGRVACADRTNGDAIVR